MLSQLEGNFWLPNNASKLSLEILSRPTRSLNVIILSFMTFLVPRRFDEIETKKFGASDDDDRRL